MGLLYALKQASVGNFSNAFNGIFVSDSLLAAQDQAGSALTQKIASQQAAGLVSAEDAITMYGQLAPSTESDQYWSASGDTPLQVFQSTVNDRASAIGQAGSAATNKILGLGAKLIPWQVYVLGLVLLMIWLYPIWKPFAASLYQGKK